MSENGLLIVLTCFLLKAITPTGMMLDHRSDGFTFYLCSAHSGSNSLLQALDGEETVAAHGELSVCPNAQSIDTGISASLLEALSYQKEIWSDNRLPQIKSLARYRPQQPRAPPPQPLYFI